MNSKNNKQIKNHEKIKQYQEKYFGKIGLPNLGNTCYANSVIQVLSQIFQLSIFFITGEYKKFINKNNEMGSEGIIVREFAKVIKVLWTNRNVVIQDFKINDQIKKAYYYDQEKSYEMKQVMIYLLDSISKNNCLYNGYEQHDCIEFMIYLIDIIHEDLNQADRKKISPIELNTNNLEEVVKYKMELFNRYNDSFISKIFYGMFQIETTCCECFNSEYNLETFNFVNLPIFKTPNKPLNHELEKFQKKIKSYKHKNDKKKYIIPGRNQFYFINCIIIPYHMNQKSYNIRLPILIKNYINIQIKFICKIIKNLLNEYSLIPTLLANNHEKFKAILDEQSYICQLFKKPNNISIYFVQLENNLLNIESMNKTLKPDNFIQLINSNYTSLLKDTKEPNEKTDIFALDNMETVKLDEQENNSQKIKEGINENEVVNTLIESSSSISIKNDSNQLNIDYLFMTINLYYKMKYEFLKFPRLFKFSSIASLKKLYEMIFAYYNINNHEIKKNSKFDPHKYKLNVWGEDISKFQFSKDNYELLLKNDKNLESSSPYPFTLCFYFKESNSKNKSEKKIFIPLPFTDDLLINYIAKIKRNNLNELYEFKDSIIYIIWFESNLKHLKELEEKANLNQIIIMDPFSNIENRSNQKKKMNEKAITFENVTQTIKMDEKSLTFQNLTQKINNMEKVTDLLDNYTDYEKYDENNPYYCEKCQKEVIAFKKIDFHCTPNILILYFEKKINGFLYKTPIKFPINEQLDLSKYYKGEKTENRYELISIINFVGNNITGHYNVYCKHPLENKWHLFNDSACYIIQDISKDIKYEDVYAIVYKKIDYSI